MKTKIKRKKAELITICYDLKTGKKKPIITYLNNHMYIMLLLIICLYICGAYIESIL